MKNTELLDIYSDYLISAFGQTTGTGLAELMGGSVSHDQIQRLLSGERLGSSALWQVVKVYVRQIQQADGVVIIDDSIAEKPYTDENEIICWHYDHSQDRNIKGINFPHHVVKSEANHEYEEWDISAFRINPKLQPAKVK